MKKLLAEIEREIDTAEFTTLDTEEVGDARGYTIKTKDWHFVVLEFGIEDQGFPPGSKGYDGTAVKAGTVMRLTRELAEKAFKKAKEQHENPQPVDTP